MNEREVKRMCEYCEKGKKIEEVENDNIYFTIFGRFLRVHGRVLSIPLGRTVPIEYCPMCRKEVNIVDKEDKEIEDFLKYLKVADEVCKEKGKVYEFECPICKGKAKAIKNSYNEHLWSKCENCDMNVIQ